MLISTANFLTMTNNDYKYGALPILARIINAKNIS